MVDPENELTKFHRDLMEWLEKRGQEVMEEVPFPPYQVDIYLPRLHAAVEADGPMHSGPKDRNRDQVLWDEYKLNMAHVSMDCLYKDNSGQLVVIMTSLISGAFESSYDRREFCKMKLPLL